MATQVSYILSKSLPDLADFKKTDQQPTLPSQEDSGLHSSKDTLNDSEVTDLTHDEYQLEHEPVDSVGYTPMNREENAVYDEPVFPEEVETSEASRPTTAQLQHLVASPTLRTVIPGLQTYVTGEGDGTDAKSCSIETKEFQQMYNQQPVQKVCDEYDTVIDKRHTCCISLQSLLLLGIIFAMMFGIASFAMSSYLFISPLFKPMDNTTAPLTKDNWTRMRQIISSEVDRGIQEYQIAFDEKLDRTTQELESLKLELAELKAKSQIYLNDTKDTIIEIFQQVNDSIEQITVLNEIANNTVSDLLELTIKQQMLENDFNGEITGLKTLLNSTKSEIKEDFEHLQMEIDENVTQIERNFRDELKEVANVTATDIARLSLQLALVEEQVDTLQNKTYQFEKQQNQTMRELETLNDTLNSTNIRITESDSKQTEELELLESEFSEQVTTIKTFLNSTRMQLKDDLRYLSVETRENLTMLEESLEVKLSEFAITTHNNLTATEKLINALANDSANSIQQVQFELSQELNASQITLSSLQKNITSQFQTLSISLEGVENDFSSQIQTNNRLTAALATEAKQNYTQLTSIATNDKAELTTSLSALQSQLDRDIDQATERISRVLTSISMNQDTITELKQKIEPISIRANRLESKQQSLSTSLDRLIGQVQGYHSNAGKSLSSTKTLSCLTVFITLLLLYLF